MKTFNIALAVILCIFCLLALSNQLNAALISDFDKADWENAGLLNSPPVFADVVFTIIPTPGIDLEIIVANAKDQAKTFTNSHPNSYAIIYFPQGIYELNNSIDLDHTYHNIIFQGDGSDKTLLKFNTGNPNTNCFYIHGYENVTSDKNYLDA